MNISLRAEPNILQQDESSNEDENITILVKKLGKFLQKDKNFKFENKRKFHKKKDVSTSSQSITCFECGKEGHMKADCPTLARKSSHKGKKEFKLRGPILHGMTMT